MNPVPPLLELLALVLELLVDVELPLVLVLVALVELLVDVVLPVVVVLVLAALVVEALVEP